MLSCGSCYKQFLLLETLTRLHSANCRQMMIQLSKSSKLMWCTLMQITESRVFHTDVCQRQLKQKDGHRHNTLVEAKDKAFSELTLGEKGEHTKIAVA